MKEKEYCSTCKADISVVENSTIFNCPNCGKTKIVRCGKCRILVVPYECPECHFIGP
jgi:predicted RNA-binding Zn-ribbon protein involved in translation (DUF1610 family)